MDPKDLKNSEELKSTIKNEPEQPKKVVDSDENKEKTEEVTEEAKEIEKEPVSEVKSEEKIPDPDIKNEEQEKEQNPEEEVPPVDENEKEIFQDKKNKVDKTMEAEDTESEEDSDSSSDKEEIISKEEPEEKVNLKKDNTSEIQKSEKEETVVEAKDKKTIKKEEVKDQDELKKDKKEIKAEKEKEEKLDFSTYSQVELVNALRDLLKEGLDKELKEKVDTIKSFFYKLLKQENDLIKKKFLDEGGDILDFVAEANPYEQDIKDLLKEFRKQRIVFNKNLEQVKEDNLKKKYEIIEKIKDLINNEESINKTFQEFRELQSAWHEIGLVPQSKMKDLWETYHFHVENFYDYVKINKELRDLDLKKNLEAKLKLCEKAEELLLEPSVIRAFNILQKYHEQWREIGPVPRDKKDDIWERFKAATSKINKKHQEFFENRKADQKKNLEAKIVLCEKAEEIANFNPPNHKEWDEKSKELIELQKVWRTIGFAPKRDNNKIYERFRKACDTFFDSKRDFFAKNKELQLNNLQLKIDLCLQAEGLKDSTDWKKTTQDFINIQKQWKEIGPVPRKHSDAVWKRFRAACDYFFQKKSEHFSNIDDEQDENLKLKEALIKEVDDFESTGNTDDDLKSLKKFQRRWTEIGHVPIKQKDNIQNRFRDAINKHFDNLNLDDTKRNILKFRNKVSNFSETSKGQNKIRFEREKYLTKLKQLENDLVLLDNNIGFFTHSKNAESLIADVNKKIEQTREKIEFLKNKIKIIDEYEKDG